MKNSFVFIIALLLFSCNTTSTSTSTQTTSTVDRIISLKQTTDIMTYLASDELKGRDTGSEGFDMASDYVIEFFDSNNLQPFYKNYKVAYTAKNKNAYNLLAINQTFDPTKKTIILSGHLDHIGMNETGEDKINNGANDNASGVTAAMQIGAYLADKVSIDENVLVALFSGEEMGLLGSKHLAKKLKKEGIAVDLVFNFEMIGSTLTDAPNTVYLTGFKNSNMANVMNQTADRELVTFFKKANDMNLFKRSDNYPFFEEYNIPAQTFSSFDFSNYEYYHHPNDEVEELELDNMNAIINSLATTFENVLLNDTTIELY